MLAKERLRIMKQEIEKRYTELKIIDASTLDLLDRIDIPMEKVPKDGRVIFESPNKKIVSDKNDKKTSFYLIQEGYNSELGYYVKKYQEISLVEDFDVYYEEIKILKQKLLNEGEKKSKTTYYFIMTLASIILIIGGIGSLALLGISIELGIATIISTAIFPAILYGIAKIIDLLSNQKS